MKQNAGIGNGQAWSRKLADLYQSGMAHCFVLHFNTADYVGETNLTLRDYVANVLLKKRDVVVFYNPADGITFAETGMRSLFDKAVGLEVQADAAVAALASLTGGSTPAGPAPLPKAPTGALPLLSKLLRSTLEVGDGEGRTRPIRVAVILEYAETLVPNADYPTMSPDDRAAVVTIQQWARDPEIIRSGGIVLMITRNLADLHEALRSVSSRIEAVAVPLPDCEARLAYINYYLETHEANRQAMIEEQAQAEVEAIVQGGDIGSDEVQALHDRARATLAESLPMLKLDMEPEVLARQTAGLSRIHIEDILLRALHAGQPVTAELVSERKQEIIRSEFADVLEIMEPELDFSMIGGHDTLKAYLQDYVVKALRAGDREIAPLGILLMGPPGTGKTAIVQALAKESGFNAIVLNLAKILGQYVGNSERNLERALQAIEALSPCIVFTDEVDQKFQRGGSGGDGGSSVNRNIFSRVMEFMSDESHRGRVVWVAATNRPDLMDAALRRPGRFDVKAPMLIPTPQEWPDVIRALLRQCGIKAKLDVEGLASRLDGWTGAEAKALLQKARQVAGRNGRRQVTQEDVEYALTVVVPSTADIELMTALALQNCSDLELVPEAIRDLARDRKGLQATVKAGQQEAIPVRRGQREL